jgi:glycosyltransferase involved in cell wall biosynthesis
MLEAFALWAKAGMSFELRIGGYGPLLPAMERFAEEKGIRDRITFLGLLDKVRIAEEMNRADAYLFSSQYETFSVVCAQALCCGTPLVGPPLEAVAEYAPEEGWVRVASDSASAWIDALEDFRNGRERFDRGRIAENVRALLDPDRILERYREVLR